MMNEKVAKLHLSFIVHHSSFLVFFSGPLEESVEELQLFCGRKNWSLSSLGDLRRKWGIPRGTPRRCALSQETRSKKQGNTSENMSSLGC
jgi:hypothetical protein